MHLAIAMDWNRRWAKERLSPSGLWHKMWFENSKKIIEVAVKSKVIDCLTLWALSKENIKERNPDELEWIFNLINKLKDLEPLLEWNNVKFETIWDLLLLPKESRKILDEIKSKTSKNSAMILAIALGYSWQDEIVRATKKIIKAWLNPDEIDEKTFRNYTDVANLPLTDLIIRTWIHSNWEKIWGIKDLFDILLWKFKKNIGCNRHSWLMLYDSAYAEYYFTSILWPDFKKEDLLNALDAFNKTKRTKWK